MTIPADRFHDNGDGTAWLVSGIGGLEGSWRHHDRPCDTCGGSMVIDTNHFGDRLMIQPCTNCFNGRHAFIIDVAYHYPIATRTLTVAVRPGMVLEIVDETDIFNGVEVPARHVIWRYTGEAWLVDGTNPIQRITLPSAAKPGDWAVLLDIEEDR